MPRQKMRSGGSRGAGTRAPALVLLGLGASTCTPLFGGFATDNPDNCVRNAGLCQAPAEACNPLTKLCEPAVLLTDIAPPGGSNAGGELVTLSGDRFVPGMAVSFDGVPALSVTVSSAQQLTALTPPRPGRQGPVTVELVHPEGQRVPRDKLFRYYAEVSFQQRCFTGPAGTRTVAVGDFNADRRTDLIVVGFSLVQVYLSSGDGLTFQGGTAISPGSIPQRPAAADVNGDGKTDLVVAASAATSSVVAALGNGDGTFQPVVKTPLSQPAYGLALGDVDGDGRPDALSLQGKDLVVQPGRGDGTFLTGQNTPFAIQDASSSAAITLADLDGDGRLDVIATNPIEQGISILFGQPGGFTSPLQLALSAQPLLTAVSDYNQDGVLDLLIGLSRTAQKIELMQGLDGRSFGALPGLMLPSNVRLEAQGDVNAN